MDAVFYLNLVILGATLFRYDREAGLMAWRHPTVAAWGWAGALASLALVFLVASRNAVIPLSALCVLGVLAAASLVGRQPWAVWCAIAWTALLQLRQPHQPLSVIPVVEEMTLTDLAIAAVLLAQTLTHYRFHSLCEWRHPTVSRPRGWRSRKPSEGAAEPREAAPASWPAPDFFAILPLFVAFPITALVLWQLVPVDDAMVAYSGLPIPILSVLGLIWMLGGVVLVVVAAFAIVDQRCLSPSEAELQLNDVLWQELRSELDHSAKVIARDAYRLRQRPPKDKRQNQSSSSGGSS